MIAMAPNLDDGIENLIERIAASRACARTHIEIRVGDAERLTSVYWYVSKCLERIDNATADTEKK